MPGEQDASETAPVAEAPVAPRKGKTGKPKTTEPKGEKKVVFHSYYRAMILEAVTMLADKGGSSFQAIKKYIADTHKIDVAKQGAFIRKAVVKLVETGQLSQVKGKGAAGSFKLAVKTKPAKKPAEEKNPKVAKKADGTPKKTKNPPAQKKTTAAAKKPAPAKPKKEEAAAKPKKKEAAPKPKKKETTASPEMPTLATAVSDPAPTASRPKPAKKPASPRKQARKQAAPKKTI